VIEGAGFFATVLAIPSMLARIVTGDERDFVMAMWSAYMPAGIMVMLLVGPLVPIIGWRNLWFTNALVAGACGVLLATCAPRLTGAVLAEPTDRVFSDVARIVRNPRCLMLAPAFFAYSCLMFSLAFALPALLTSRNDLALGMAGMMSALVLALSAIGNISSGFLLRAGVPI
jgi:MFS transporter, DHA1 family, inner membrane transport protein